VYIQPVIAESPANNSGRRATVVICLAIFIVALGIRLLGIGWGLKNDLHNQSYHPDESLIFDFVHKSNVYRGPADKQYYNYGTLYYAINRVASAMGATYGATPRPESLALDDVKTGKQWDDLNAYASQSIQWGRYASALAGAATAVLIFLILVRWTTILGALAGAALIVFSPAHVEHSRFQTVDIISLFFVALTIYQCVRMLDIRPRDPNAWWTNVLLAAVLVGLSASTRYSNGALLLSVWAVLAIRRPASWPWMAGAAALVAVLCFALTTPGVVTDTTYFVENFKFQAEHAKTGHGLVFVGRPSAFFYHLYLFVVGTSALATIIGLVGLGYAAFRLHAWAWVILAFFIPYYISIGLLKVMFLRYDFPLYVGLAVGFGYAISAIQRRWNSKLLAGVVAAVSLAGFESPQSGIRGVALFTKWMMGTDPRDEAGAYLKDLAKKEKNLEVGILGDSPWYWTAAIAKDASYIKFQPPDFKRRYLEATKGPRVVPFITGQIPAYATYSSYEVEDALRLRDKIESLPESNREAVAAANAQIQALNGIYKVDRVFGEGGPAIHDLEYIRPTIWVLKRRDPP
jgi:hypothetical protein